MKNSAFNPNPYLQRYVRETHNLLRWWYFIPINLKGHISAANLEIFLNYYFLLLNGKINCNYCTFIFKKNNPNNEIYFQLTDEVLKFTVINRGGRKSIQSYRTKFSSKPPRNHGFAIFVLSQLPIPENASLIRIKDVSR